MLRVSEKFDAAPGARGARTRYGLPARREQFDIMIGGRRVRLGERTIICGVLNVTPDSFSDGGRYLDPRRAIRHAVEMARAGADWIDVGGESTRPGASPVSAEEELRRVLPVIRGVRERAPDLPISVDTSKGLVATEAVRAGASLINDVSGLRFDPTVAEVAASCRVPLVLMHLRGRPATMQHTPFARAIFRSLLRGLDWSVRRAVALGVDRSQLIADPGLGFGKTRRQNFEIMAGLAALRRLRLPILIGTSRKSFIQAVVAGGGLDAGWQAASAGSLREPVHREGSGRKRERRKTASRAIPAALDFGDAAAVAGVILAGAHIVRVHNIAATLPAARIADAMLAAARQ